MAAILCQGINEFCKLLCLPCKACGIGCRGLGDLLSSPFFPYLAVTYGLNIPAVVYGIRGFGYGMEHHHYSSSTCLIGVQWLIANTFLAGSHLLASCYLVYKIRQDREMNQWMLGNQSRFPTNYGGTTTTTTTADITTTSPGVVVVAPTTTITTSSNLHAVTTGTDDAVMAKQMEQGTYQPPPPTTTTSTSVFAKAVPMVQAAASQIRASASNASQASQQPRAVGSGPPAHATGTSNSLTRIRYVLCYDPLVAIYMLIFLGWIIWQSIGTKRAFELGETGNYCSLVQDWTMISVICGYLYMGLVGIAFLCSLCCLR